MDEEIYFAQCVLYNLSTIRIEIDLSCELAKCFYRKYMTVFESLRDEKDSFSYNQLSIFLELELLTAPLMQSSMNCLRTYQKDIERCFDNSQLYVSLPIESPNRSEQIWQSISETKKNLKKTNECLDVVQDVFHEFISQVRQLITL